VAAIYRTVFKLINDLKNSSWTCKKFTEDQKFYENKIAVGQCVGSEKIISGSSSDFEGNSGSRSDPTALLFSKFFKYLNIY